MKLIRRLVEIIGDDEWADSTLDASLDGLGVVTPTRLIRSTTLTEEEISETEVARLAKIAGPLKPKRPSPVRIGDEA